MNDPLQDLSLPTAGLDARAEAIRRKLEAHGASRGKTVEQLIADATQSAQRDVLTPDCLRPHEVELYCADPRQLAQERRDHLERCEYCENGVAGAEISEEAVAAYASEVERSVLLFRYACGKGRTPSANQIGLARG